MDSLNELSLQLGHMVTYQGKPYQIRQLMGNLQKVMLEDPISGRLLKAPVAHLAPPTPEAASMPVLPLEMISDEQWVEAQRRLAIIRPLLERRGDGELLQAVAQQHGVGAATLYRWLKLYDTTGQASQLVPIQSDGGQGKNRLSPEVEALVKDAIEKVYLTKQRLPLKRVYLDVIARCKRHELAIPHINTVRNRVMAIRQEKILRFRHGHKAADDKYLPQEGEFPNAVFPLAVVQIDHTPADIILVDDQNRMPLGRPWVTMAIDIYSRMVVGFYVSFETPGALGTGMCVASSILPKEAWLNRLDVSGEWPCWGRMKKIYVDNAKEFRGTMLKRACEEYDIDLEFRPVRKANYGGHIERWMDTLAKEIHTLPGTTFSNPQKRGEYSSAKQAALTLANFEKWLLHLIVNIYHQRIHTTLGCTPLEKFEEGVYLKTGLPARTNDELKVKLDFLPYFERTVQEYGVVLDHIHYYSDVLRPWVHALEDDSPKSKHKRKFIFKRDPRDISVLFFYDPKAKTYFPIPYRDLSRPPITLWEHQHVLTQLANSGTKTVDEAILFDAYQKLQAIAEQAVAQTQRVRHQRQRAKTKSNRAKSIQQEMSSAAPAHNSLPPIGGPGGLAGALSLPRPVLSTASIQPFDELEYGTFD